MAAHHGLSERGAPHSLLLITQKFLVIFLLFISDTTGVSFLLINTCLTFPFLLAQGTSVAILGPTLIELSCQIETSLAHMSYAFTSRSIGYLTGSIVGGWLFDKYNGHVVLSLSCLWATLMMWVLPYVKSIYWLMAVIALLGVALGSLDTGMGDQIFLLMISASVRAVWCMVVNALSSSKFLPCNVRQCHCLRVLYHTQIVA